MFTEIYDENGNENDKYQLNESLRLRIINFFLSCLSKEVLDSPKFIELIVSIAFHIALKDVEYEEIEKDDDINSYEPFEMFSASNYYEVVYYDEFDLIGNSIQILNMALKLNENLIIQHIKQVIQCPFKWFKCSYFKFHPIMKYILEFLKFEFKICPDDSYLSLLLDFAFELSFDINYEHLEEFDLSHLTRNMIDYATIIGKLIILKNKVFLFYYFRINSIFIF